MSLSELHPWLSLLPPLVAIGFAIAFRQVYAALVLGLLTGTIILSGGNPLQGLAGAVDLCVRVFRDPDSTRVILFSCAVGAVIAFTQRSGGVQGLVEWLSQRAAISSRRRAQLLAIAIGTAVPIESSISILVTGTVVRPIFDGLKISREKLAYICDSTSAPICALIPVNAWGAYMAGLLARQGVEKPLLVYFKAIPFNYYAWAAILLVLFLTLSRKDFFSMKRAEQRAREKGQVLRPGSIPLVSHEVTNLEPKQGVRPRASNMVIPLAVMIVMMVAGLLITGRGDLANGSGSTAVLWAVLAALAAGGLLYWARGVMGPGELTGLFFKGVGGLVPIATLMMLAFALGQLCRDLNTGLYVAELVKNMLVPSLVPVVLFVTTGFIAFATGTSWGTWAVMVPIGLPLALQMGINPVLAVAAITSGGVFGDHCSPISDTTLVSSMASASDHMDHVNTQLPYALTAGLVAAVFFLLAGVTM